MTVLSPQNAIIICIINEPKNANLIIFIVANQCFPDHEILAYSTDEKGNEKYNLVFKDLEMGELLSDCVENIGGMEWCNDNKTI